MAAHPRKHRPPRAGRALLLAAILYVSAVATGLVCGAVF